MRRAWRRFAAFVLTVSVAVSGCRAGETPSADRERAAAASRLVPDEARVAHASAELRERLAASPLALFRFVNQEWTREVCAALAGDFADLPTARLHGDAHIEQYAVTATARGLDDFDDSARGPAAVDIVRFLGSLELTAGARGWNAALPAVLDAFFEGYRRALKDPTYLPPDPAVVKRLRAEPPRSPDAFLAWADSLMQPVAPDDLAQLDIAWAKFELYAARADPAFTPAFLRRKKVGWLRLGIGSALTRKILIRTEGPSAALDDDAVLEAKEVTALRDEPCLTIPRTAEVFRVVEGLRQIGRIDHRLIVALPMLPGKEPDARGWWVRTWDRFYRELEIADLASPYELRELAHDVGAQLGGTNLVESPGNVADQKRLAELEGITRLESRIRQVAHELAVALLGAWQEFKTR